jgi:hypothetical protein
LNRLRRTVAHLTDELSTLRATAQSGLSDPPRSTAPCLPNWRRCAPPAPPRRPNWPISLPP